MSDFSDNFKQAILEFVQEEEPKVDEVVEFYEYTTPATSTYSEVTQVIVKCQRDGVSWNYHFLGDLSQFLSAVLFRVD